DRAWPLRRGPALRGAAQQRQLSAEGNGLPPRAEARGAAPPPRPRQRLRGTLRPHPDRPEPWRPGRRRRRAARRRRGPARRLRRALAFLRRSQAHGHALLRGVPRLSGSRNRNWLRFVILRFAPPLLPAAPGTRSLRTMCVYWQGGAAVKPGSAASLGSQNHPQGMDDAGDIAQQRQQDVEPELQPEPDLEEHAERRQEDGEEDADDVHWRNAVPGRQWLRLTTARLYSFKPCSPHRRSGASPRKRRLRGTDEDDSIRPDHAPAAAQNVCIWPGCITMTLVLLLVLPSAAKYSSGVPLSCGVVP